MFAAYKGCYKYKPVINKQPFDREIKFDVYL